MGYTIGMPSLKLSNIEGKGGKHCGNFRKVAAEALKERKGLDMDINPELAEHNIYEGFATASELINYSDKHIDELNEWRAEHGERACDRRKLKKDTVVMCATVIKPPAEMMSELSDEQQQKFLADSLEIFKNFVGGSNVKSAAFHYDERVPHLHILWEPMADEHRICAKDMHNIKFFGKLNREMPKQLRAKGWSMVDDCRAYDKAEEEQKRLEMGEEQYREYRKALKADRGRDSRAYKHDVEQQIAQEQQELEQLRVLREQEEQAAEMAKIRREANESAAKNAEDKKNQTETELAALSQALENKTKELADVDITLVKRLDIPPRPSKPKCPDKPLTPPESCGRARQKEFNRAMKEYNRAFAEYEKKALPKWEEECCKWDSTYQLAAVVQNADKRQKVLWAEIDSKQTQIDKRLREIKERAEVIDQRAEDVYKKEREVYYAVRAIVKAQNGKFKTIFETLCDSLRKGDEYENRYIGHQCYDEQDKANGKQYAQRIEARD